MGASLSEASAAAAFAVVMRGEATPARTAALLMGLRAKGETAEEIAGAASAMRDAMIRLIADDPTALVDTCGTGGGRVGTLNISTAAAFVVAGAGVRVAKHGNRSYTSRSGSADVLEALGVDIAMTPELAAGVLRDAGIVFLYAPTYHPAMRHVAPVRKELGVTTIMNLLGPLVNPAGVVRQVIGVSELRRAPLVAHALVRMGAVHALVLHATIGMDEVSPSGVTSAWEVSEGTVRCMEIDPVAHELACDDLEALAGGTRTRMDGGSRSCCRGGGGRWNGAPWCSTQVRHCTYRERDGRSRRPCDGRTRRSKVEPARTRSIDCAPRHLAVEAWRPQYFRMTPTTTPWMSTSRSWKRMGCMVALAGCNRIQPPGSR